MFAQSFQSGIDCSSGAILAGCHTEVSPPSLSLSLSLLRPFLFIIQWRHKKEPTHLSLSCVSWLRKLKRDHNNRRKLSWRSVSLTGKTERIIRVASNGTKQNNTEHQTYCFFFVCALISATELRPCFIVVTTIKFTVNAVIQMITITFFVKVTLI